MRVNRLIRMICRKHHLCRLIIRHSCRILCPPYLYSFSHLQNTGFAVEFSELMIPPPSPYFVLSKFLQVREAITLTKPLRDPNELDNPTEIRKHYCLLSIASFINLISLAGKPISFMISLALCGRWYHVLENIGSSATFSHNWEIFAWIDEQMVR